jgi:B12-binding domain/radical SAM domain protein
VVEPRFTFVVDRLNRTATAALLVALEAVVRDPAAGLRTVRTSRALDLEIDSSGSVVECICMSAMTEDFQGAAGLLGEMRRKFGRGFVSLCGGPHATGDPEGVLAAGFDFCCVGEGESVLRDLAARPAVVRSSLGGEAAREGDGLREGEAALRESPAREGSGAPVGGAAPERVLRGEPIELEDVPPLPERIRFPAYIEIGRGCRWGCAYCQTPRIFGHRERFRSPTTVERTIARYAASGMKDFRLLLPNALGYGSREAGVPDCGMLEELLRRASLAARGGRIFLGSFPSEMRPDYVTPEAIGILKKYVANRQVVIGAQSGSRRMLDLLGRGHGPERIEEACHVVSAQGFLPTVDLMFGLPAEEESDRAATFDLAERLRVAGSVINMHFFMPLPGTPLAGSKPRFLNEAERGRLEELATKGVIRGRWRRQEEIALEWSSGRAGTGPSR